MLVITERRYTIYSHSSDKAVTLMMVSAFNQFSVISRVHTQILRLSSSTVIRVKRVILLSSVETLSSATPASQP